MHLREVTSSLIAAVANGPRANRARAVEVDSISRVGGWPRGERRTRAMRVVLALDGSDSSIRARDLVAGLPWPAGTSMTMVTVSAVPAAWFAPGEPAGDWFPRAEEAMGQEAADQLARLTTPLEDRGWEIERRVVLDRPAGAILAAADDVDADLIVLGSRGRGPIRTMVPGRWRPRSRTPPGSRSSLPAAARCLVPSSPPTARNVPPGSRTSSSIGGSSAACLRSRRAWPRLSRGRSRSWRRSPHSERSRWPSSAMSLIARYRHYATGMAGRLTDVGMPAEADVRTGDAAHEIIAAASATRPT